LKKYSIKFDGIEKVDKEDRLIKLVVKPFVEEKTIFRFSRFYKNEKMMVQDMISCVKELTDLEDKYNNQY
jgi:hypothetical protein